MNLIIDIGNTQTKIGVFKNDILIDHYRISTESLHSFLIDLWNSDFNKSIISHVADYPKEVWEFLSSKEIIIKELTHETSLPILLDYQTPNTLGLDRIANAAGAYSLFPNRNTLIIDGGTCLKYDYITDRGVYLGGAISPGLKMRLKSVHDYTAKLPLIEIEELSSPIGKSTKESILSGCYLGYINEIIESINQQKTQFYNLNIVLTGGDLKYIEKELKKLNIFAEQNLTLIGLNKILEYNA